MTDSFQKLKELDLSRDEVNKIGEALKNTEFRKLLTDYVEEIQNPENRKLYEQEVIQLERERGIDATFINPKPGYVIKTSSNGKLKTFINISINELIGKPTANSKCENGTKGLQWSLPYSLAPPREDVDNKGQRCRVFDVVFHPNTLQLAQKNKDFSSMVNSTACDAIERNFDVKLDKNNLKFPKLQYKGFTHSTIIRKPSKECKPVKREGEEKEFYDQLYAHADSVNNKPSKKKSTTKKTNIDDKSPYTTPKYLIKYRNHVDLQEFVESKDAKMNVTVPRELVIEINLPLLKSSTDITLDVTEKTVQLLSEKPAKYKLNLILPYQVYQDNGNAKFDKDLKMLLITLPVKRNLYNLNDFNRDDSGVDSDLGGSLITTPDEDDCNSTDNNPVMNKHNSENNSRTSNFLDVNLHYNLPEFTCHLFDNNLAFTLNVKNVDESSIEKLIDQSIHIKFISISSSFYQINYAFYLKIQNEIKTDEITIEAWDNNVVVQIPFIDNNNCDNQLRSYWFGTSKQDIQEKFIEEPSILNSALLEGVQAVNEEEFPKLTEFVQQETTVVEDGNVKEETVKTDNGAESKAINILGTSYESSGDELSCSSFSPTKNKGILKRLARTKYLTDRSISESSLDDFLCSSSFENCHTSLDSVIPEDGEISASLKKTVRFNDVIIRQLYRSNSSILGQRKKNQQRRAKKKRALERRHSESEASELEDKKDEEDSESPQDNGENTNETSDDNKKEDIFHMDLNF